MPELHRVPRTGLPVLEVDGDLAAEASSHIAVNGGPLQNRWHEVRIYRAYSGKLVGWVRFRTSWQGERDCDTAAVFDLPAALTDWLCRDYNPLDHWQGYPPEPHYAERNRRIKEAITAGYRRAVSEALADLPETAERVE